MTELGISADAIIIAVVKDIYSGAIHNQDTDDS